MKPLSLPIKNLLEEPQLGARVVRTWVKVQRRRQPVARPFMQWALAASVAALAVSLWWQRSPPVEAVVAPLAVAQVKPAAPPMNLTRAMIQGRATHLVPRANVEETTPPDVVGEMLQGAVEAFSNGDAKRAALLLSETTAHHPDDPRTGAALVTLGWLQLEHLHQPAEAKRSLTRALELDPRAELFDRAWPLLERANGSTK